MQLGGASSVGKKNRFYDNQYSFGMNPAVDGDVYGFGAGGAVMSHGGADMYGGYSMAGSQYVASLGATSTGFPPVGNRTIYIGSIDPETTMEELLNHVRGGYLESVRILPEKGCAFISFVDPQSAALFHNESNTVRKLVVRGRELRVGWGKPTPLPVTISSAIQSGASRNIYLGHIHDDITEDFIREDLARFGPIDKINILPEKKIAFVHFASIASAMKAVVTLPTEPRWAGVRINYGKDRCAANNKTITHIPGVTGSFGGHSGQAGPSTGAMYSSGSGFGGPYFAQTMAQSSGGFSDYGSGAVPGRMGAVQGGGIPNRTVYLGGLHPDTTMEDLCNHIRGGIIEQIKLMPEKHCAFITFVDPTSAMAFYNICTYQGFVVRSRRARPGWGKPSPLSNATSAAVHAGATRNVYLGSIDDTITEERLRNDFNRYGTVETVNIIRDKNIAFVNFTSIATAVRAVNEARQDAEYSRFKINYGKDRCANPPRSGPPTGSSGGQSSSNAGTGAVAGGEEEESGEMNQEGFAAAY